MLKRVLDTPNLSQDAKELLEAVGCLELGILASKNPESLLEEMHKANDLLKITKLEFTIEEVSQWVSHAVEEVGEDAVEGIPPMVKDSDEESIVTEESETVVDFTQHPKVTHLLKQASAMEKLAPELIKEENLAISDIPEALLLVDCDLDTAIKTSQGIQTLADFTAEKKLPGKEKELVSQDVIIAEQPVRELKKETKEAEPIAQKSTGEEDIKESSDFGDFETLMAGEHHIKPLERGEREVLTVSRDLNKNVPMASRRYVKGVLHPDPLRVKLGALAILQLQASFVIVLLAIVYFVMVGLTTGESHFIPILICLGWLFVSVIIYGVVGLRAACRVCGQKQFYPKQCSKHKKAHYIPFMGYMLPTALQMLIYKWFYCIYCGTAIRLKK